MATRLTLICEKCGGELEINKDIVDMDEIICPFCKNKANKIQFSFLSKVCGKGFLKTHKSKYID